MYLLCIIPQLLEEALHRNERAGQERGGAGDRGDPAQREALGLPWRRTKGHPEMGRQKRHVQWKDVPPEACRQAINDFPTSII